MAKLPRRPDEDRLRSLEPDVRVLEPDTPLYRIYSRGGDYPTTWNAFRRFGPLSSRFDHHLSGEEGNPRLQPDRAILYAAGDIPTAFAEVFQHNGRRIDRRRRDPWLVAFRLTRSLALLDLGDTRIVRAGASMKLVSDSVLTAQRWSTAFHELYPSIQGVIYRSSLTGRFCVALYERAEGAFEDGAKVAIHRSLADPLMHRTILSVADEIGYALI